MYKATAKDVKDLQRWGKDDEIVKQLMKHGVQPNIHETAYFAPAAANWAWRIGLITINGQTYELLTRFGVVEGGRAFYINSMDFAEGTK